MTSQDTTFTSGRSQEILTALKNGEPEEALRLARHLVAEGGAEPGPRRAEQLVAAAAVVAQFDATAATDRSQRHQADYRALVSGICTDQELDDAMLTVLCQQGLARGWLPEPLHDVLAAAAPTSTFLTEALTRIRRGR